jgi:hypothetical protein
MKSLLDRYLQIVNDPDSFYRDNSKHTADTRQEWASLREEFRKEISSMKKGDRVVIAHLPTPQFRNRAQFLTWCTDKTFKPHVKREVVIHSPARTQTRKTWVGDGYEEIKTSTIKYEMDGYIHTVPVSSFFAERI